MAYNNKTKDFIKARKKWKRKVDNKMKDCGETDYDKKTIRVNKKVSKKEMRGGVLDTIVHEEMHKKYPNMKERTVRKKTPKKVAKLYPKAKKKLYSLYR